MQFTWSSLKQYSSFCLSVCKIAAGFFVCHRKCSSIVSSSVWGPSRNRQFTSRLLSFLYTYLHTYVQVHTYTNDDGTGVDRSRGIIACNFLQQEITAQHSSPDVMAVEKNGDDCCCCCWGQTAWNLDMSNGHLCAWHRKWVNDFASASISLFLDGLRSNSITAPED